MADDRYDELTRLAPADWNTRVDGFGKTWAYIPAVDEGPCVECPGCGRVVHVSWCPYVGSRMQKRYEAGAAVDEAWWALRREVLHAVLPLVRWLVQRLSGRA